MVIADIEQEKQVKKELGSMDIYSVLTLIGGLAFFLYGISIMSSGLEKIAGGKLEQLLRKMTSNPIRSFVLGAAITAVIQSSSAVTVMLIGLVNSGIMNLSQTVSVVIGANVGTTITAWLLSLTAIQENAGWFFRLLKPESFSPVLAFIGVFMLMYLKNNKRKNIGYVLIGFAILMTGMSLMAGAMSPLADMPEFRSIMIAFKNPLLGFSVGLLMTMIIQSSSASIGILQALTLVGGVSWGIAIPIILGQNLGTCISALIASIGVNTNAKRVAGVHIIYNILSVGICLPLFIILQLIFDFAFIHTDINPFGVAIFHTVYNIFTAFMLFPFAKFIERLAIKYIPESKEIKVENVFLDERLLLNPALAISESFRKTVEMAHIVEFNLKYSTKMLKTYRNRMVDEINENEVKIDTYEDKLNAFLLKLAGRELEYDDSNKISQMLLTIGDFERIGDHTTNIIKIAEKLSNANKKLSDESIEDLKILVKAVCEIYLMSSAAYSKNDIELARKVEPLENVIKNGTRRAKNNHIQRLKAGKCIAETSFAFSDLLNELRRIAAHAENIAIGVIQLKDKNLDKHQYSHRNKEQDLEFSMMYEDYKLKYKVKKEV